MRKIDLRIARLDALCDWPKYLYLAANTMVNAKINYVVGNISNLADIIRECIKLSLFS